MTKNFLKNKEKKRVLLDMSVIDSPLDFMHKIWRFNYFQTDKDLKKFKKIQPELCFSHRKEILLSIKYVKDVIPGNFILKQEFINKNNIDIVIQGSDYKKRKFNTKVVTFSRTKNISSTLIRRLAKKNISK